MDIKYINPFVEGSKRVLEGLLGSSPTVEPPRLLDGNIFGNCLAVIIGLVGEIKGQAIFLMDNATAINIARKMTFNDALNELDMFGESAIVEMSNMISGSTCTIAEQSGVKIDITPPSICKGDSFSISIKNKYITIPLNLGCDGDFLINISFEQR